ncbi:MAG TPA: MFS transporter, partial [Acidimicrobiia bacterium]|nr:MFS transporter [Acidimicrobiia bacterium]
PAIGATLIRLFGLAPCFYVNAASYIAVIVALWMMNTSLLHRLPRVERTTGQIREGLRYAWSERMVRTPLLMMAVIGTLAFNFQVVIPLIATKTFDSGIGGTGALLSTMGAGAVLGGLSVASRRGVSYRRLIALSMLMGVSILAAAAAPTFETEVIAIFVMGASAFAFIATANTTIQLTAAPAMRGRVMALYAIAFLGSTPIGGPIVGWVSQQFGPRAGFALGGIAAIVATAAAGWSIARRRESDEHRAPDVMAVPAA